LRDPPGVSSANPRLTIQLGRGYSLLDNCHELSRGTSGRALPDRLPLPPGQNQWQLDDVEVDPWKSPQPL
jgi:hypothetical protein